MCIWACMYVCVFVCVRFAFIAVLTNFLVEKFCTYFRYFYAFANTQKFTLKYCWKLPRSLDGSAAAWILDSFQWFSTFTVARLKQMEEKNFVRFATVKTTALGRQKQAADTRTYF